MVLSISKYFFYSVLAENETRPLVVPPAGLLRQVADAQLEHRFRFFFGGALTDCCPLSNFHPLTSKVRV